MSQVAAASSTRVVIQRSTSNPDLRICSRSSRIISTIEKMPNGKYRVVKLYEDVMLERDLYGQAKVEAMSAAMTLSEPKVTVVLEGEADEEAMTEIGRVSTTVDAA